MTLYKFASGDVFNNRIETNPRSHFYIINGIPYYNKEVLSENTATVPATDTVLNVPEGFISLYEMNINRDISVASNKIYPFITKQGALSSFKTVSTSDFQSYTYGTTITGSYPLSSSIVTEYIPASSALSVSRRLKALKNTLNYYTHISPHYAYSSSFGNKEAQDINLLSIPSIFYGGKLKPGTIDLRLYITGTLAAQIQDTRKNGELRQTYPPSPDANYGKVAGVVLYNEGVIALTGSWDLSATAEDHVVFGAPDTPKWRSFAARLHESPPAGAFPSSAAWSIEFKGVNHVPTLTMLARAPKGELNHSNNPTYLDYGFVTSSAEVTSVGSEYIETFERTIKNVVKSPYADPTGSFSKETYISKIGIYDEDNNLIAIAKLATPVRKTEDRDFTFKIKMDI